MLTVSIFALVTVALSGGATARGVPLATPLWTFAAPPTDYSTPAVDHHGDVLLAADQLSVLSGRDGSLLAQFTAPDGGKLGTTPLSLNGTIVATSSGGMMYAVARSGAVWRVLWSTNLTTAGRTACGPPSVSADGRVVFVAVGHAFIFALDAATGRIMWSRAVGRIAHHIAPVVVQDVIVIVANQIVVRALRQHNGDPVWFWTIPSDTNAPLMKITGCGADAVAVTGPSVALLNATSGAAHWVKKGMASRLPTCDAATGLLVVPSDTTTMFGLDVATGEKRWVNSLIRTRYGGAAAIADGVVYAGSNVGNIWAVNATTGGYVWAFRPAKKPLLWADITAARGSVYFKTNNGPLFALPGRL